MERSREVLPGDYPLLGVAISIGNSFGLLKQTYKRGTASLSGSKGCKVVSCQIWSSERNSATLPTPSHAWVAWIGYQDRQ